MVVVFRKVMDRQAEPTATPPTGAESEWDWYAYYAADDGSVEPQYGMGAGTLVFNDTGTLARTYYYEPDPPTPNPNGSNTPTAPQYSSWKVVEKVIGDPQYEGVATGKVIADFNTAAAQGTASGTTYTSNMITLDFLGSDYAATLGLSSDPIDGVTSFGSESTTKMKAQDGYAMGVLNDWSIGADGVITGSYSNGKNLPIAQVALAMFANPQGLSQVGETCFAETVNSGIAQIGAPMTNGAGSIEGNTIEMSNVDLSEEFVNLIRAQRGFQANTRVVTTSDQVLEELINMKR
jgi:flagellar hook-basal body protein